MKFENYLQDEFTKRNPQILDDDLPDAFDSWIAELQADELIEHAEKWKSQLLETIEMKIARIPKMEFGIKDIKSIIKEYN